MKLLGVSLELKVKILSVLQIKFLSTDNNKWR